MNKSPVVHFEMPAKDKQRASDFYSKVFGWNMNLMGEDMGGYLMAQTTDTDDQGMPKSPGAINGGFFDYKDEEGYTQPHLVISVSDINQAIEEIKGAGGQIQGEIMDIPGVGKYISFKDTEGNLVGALQAH